jgi:hypothetical protein
VHRGGLRENVACREQSKQSASLISREIGIFSVSCERFGSRKVKIRRARQQVEQKPFRDLAQLVKQLPDKISKSSSPRLLS